MFPRPPAPPIERKPTLPMPYEIMHDIPGLISFDNMTQELLAMAETGDAVHLKSYLESMAYLQLRGCPANLLLTAIDPDTGDSIVHRAAAAGNINVLNAITQFFGPYTPKMERLLWVLITHQNLAGNTALHAAGHAGSLKGAKAVYRLYYGFDCSDVDDSFHDDEVSRAERSTKEYPIDIPVEYFDWSKAEDDPEEHLPALNFVCTKNWDGQDAADVARLAGHEDLAIWLEGLIKRIDRDGMREKKDYMQKARLHGLENHWYHDN